jgi:hypothetical protein
MHVLRYYEYLKGENTSTGLGKEDLLLYAVQCSTQQSRDSKVFNVAMAKLLGMD